MSIFDRLLTAPTGALVSATPAPAPTPPPRADVSAWSGQKAARFSAPAPHGPVGKSDDLTRILALARRPPVDVGSPRAEALVEIMMERLGRGERKCACRHRHLNRLNAIQAWALHEAPLTGGLIGIIGCGVGKSVLDILTAMVMPDCKQAVLLIPPGLKQQLWEEWKDLNEHFYVPSIIFDDQSVQKGKIIPGRPVLHVVPYSKLSRPESTDLLRQLDPDLIIADEVHSVAAMSAARVKRLFRFLAGRPETRFCGWSGTITKKSIRNYAHLVAVALGEGSPLPIDPQVVEEWAAAIDPSDWPAPEGSLAALKGPGEDLYKGFHRRLVETRGVVATKSSAIGASINLFEQRLSSPMPKNLRDMLDEVRKTGTRPDGEESTEQAEVVIWAKQLACGFYYRWRFPKGTPKDLIDAWFKARKLWHRELRDQLEHPIEHMDSPMLCANAAARYYAGYKGELPVWASEHWRAWDEIKDKVQHDTEAVWVSDYLAENAAEWGKRHKGLIWYEYNAFGKRVAEIGDLPLHGGGPDAEARIKAEKGDRSLVVSLKAHGTGRDGLQRFFNEQLFANPPASGDAWEQAISRLHRVGQEADEVSCWVYRHSLEMKQAVDRAVVQAKYIQGTLGTSQKLLAATCDFELDASEG